MGTVRDEVKKNGRREGFRAAVFAISQWIVPGMSEAKILDFLKKVDASEYLVNMSGFEYTREVHEVVERAKRPSSEPLVQVIINEYSGKRTKQRLKWYNEGVHVGVFRAARILALSCDGDTKKFYDSLEVVIFDAEDSKRKESAEEIRMAISFFVVK